MMGRGDRLVIALLAVFILDFACALALSALVLSSVLFEPECAEALEFTTSVKDRPVLETVHQVWSARVTGVSEFDFDGVHYIVKNMPKEYVDYSSWYVRMP